MTYAGEGVQKSSVAMLPNGTELWERNYVESANTVLFVAPDCPSSYADAALQASLARPTASAESMDLSFIGKGSFSSVFKCGDAVLKLTDSVDVGVEYAESLYPGGINDVVANVGLAHGLDNMSASGAFSHGYNEEITTWIATAPRIFAAAMPIVATENRSKTILMEHAKGDSPNNALALIPPSFERRVLYEFALKSCGFNGNDVSLDDTDNNMKIQVDDDGFITITKFDVMPNRQLYKA